MQVDGHTTTDFIEYWSIWTAVYLRNPRAMHSLVQWSQATRSANNVPLIKEVDHAG